MYINRIKKMRYMILGHIQLFIGVVFSLITLFGICTLLTDFEEAASWWQVIPFCAVIGGALLFCGIRNKILINSCNTLNETFQKDANGIVDLKEIALRSGMEEAVVWKRLQLLIKKRCLVNVAIHYDEERPVIVLEDNDAALFRKKISKGYTVVQCPNCGGSCTVKEGVVTKCEFCGSYIKGNSRNGL